MDSLIGEIYGHCILNFYCLIFHLIVYLIAVSIKVVGIRDKYWTYRCLTEMLGTFSERYQTGKQLFIRPCAHMMRSCRT